MNKKNWITDINKEAVFSLWACGTCIRAYQIQAVLATTPVTVCRICNETGGIMYFCAFIDVPVPTGVYDQG